MPQPSPSDLGLIAYLAYSEATSGVTHDKRPMPAWDDLGDTVQGAWIAAAAAVAEHATADQAPVGAEQENAR
ncbi:hypothetical protein [Streptomyces sp. NPDC004658]|uniref:hypothetical protein n=1 Tax=Streptomyces sp. NPDC004658 TaxID=3154672 RepID=UPI0033AFB897